MSHIDTQQNNGEIEGSGSTNSKPTLKEFLSQTGLPDDIYPKLLDMGIDWNTLLYINDIDLNELAKEELKLGFGIRVKFKSAIKSLQAEFQPKKEKIIPISIIESKQINQIQNTLKTNKDIINILNNHKQQIDEYVKSIKLKIDKKFKDIAQQLEIRKQLLHKQIDEWKQKKIINIDKEITVSYLSQKEFIKTQNLCNKLIKSSRNVKERENKMIKMIKNVFVNKIYLSTSSLIAYIRHNTSLIDITFDDNVFNGNNIDKFGLINVNYNNNMLINIPKITLNKAIKINQDIDGYKVSLKWKTSSSQNQQNFNIKYVAINNGNANDIDENKSNNNDEIEWNSNIKEKQNIKSSNNNCEFQVNILNKFLFNKTYKYCVELLIQNPIHLLIQSNITEFIVHNVVDIPLKVHSDRGHYGSYHPRHLLTDAGQYASQLNNQFNGNEMDWIIFKLKQQNALYLPTKLMIKNANAACDVKTMIISIGDGNNEWYPFNPNPVNLKKVSKAQTFSIDGVSWKVVQQKKLTHVKLEFLSNHGYTFSGGCRYCVEEFHLHGIEFV